MLTIDADSDLNFDASLAPEFLPPEFAMNFTGYKEDSEALHDPLIDFIFDDESWDPVLEEFEDFFGQENKDAKSSTCESFKQNSFAVPLITPEQYLAPDTKCAKRKRENIADTKLEHTKCLRKSNADKGQDSIKYESISLDLFATPRSTWSLAKKKRFNTMQRLHAKRLTGRFGFKKTQNKKRSIRKVLAKGRKRTTKGQFAPSKFKWVSACDLE